MKIAAIVLTLLAVAVSAQAFDPAFVNGPDTGIQPPAVREAFYCQPASSGWGAWNASIGFNSEEADDIPASLAGQNVTEVTFYVAEWGGGWTNPQSMIVNFYNSACPPGYNYDQHFDIPWSQCTATQVYAGSWYVYEVLIPLGTTVTLGTPMSIGGVVGQNWGQNGPYCGLVFTDTFQGCEMYWAGDYWGYPRWSPYSAYFGYQGDMAYCLGAGYVPTENTTWGRVRSLYR